MLLVLKNNNFELKIAKNSRYFILKILSLFPMHKLTYHDINLYEFEFN